MNTCFFQASLRHLLIYVNYLPNSLSKSFCLNTTNSNFHEKITVSKKCEYLINIHQMNIFYFARYSFFQYIINVRYREIDLKFIKSSIINYNHCSLLSLAISVFVTGNSLKIN